MEAKVKTGLLRNFNDTKVRSRIKLFVF